MGYQNSTGIVQVLRENKIFTNPDADCNATSSAPDGDLDAAYALLLAGQKWHQQAYMERGVKVTYATRLTAFVCLTGVHMHGASNWHTATTLSNSYLRNFHALQRAITATSSPKLLSCTAMCAARQAQACMTIYPQGNPDSIAGVCSADEMVHQQGHLCHQSG